MREAGAAYSLGAAVLVLLHVTALVAEGQGQHVSWAVVTNRHG